jgi:hypothetical protein
MEDTRRTWTRQLQRRREAGSGSDRVDRRAVARGRLSGATALGPPGRYRSRLRAVKRRPYSFEPKMLSHYFKEGPSRTIQTRSIAGVFHRSLKFSTNSVENLLISVQNRRSEGELPKYGSN